MKPEVLLCFSCSSAIIVEIHLYISITVPHSGADEQERELVTERENENQSMQSKSYIRIPKLFYPQVIRHKLTSSPIVNSELV